MPSLPTVPKNLSPCDYVLVVGCFDILHVGHLRLLKEASKFGPVVVCINSDESIEKLKGRKPIFSAYDRLMLISSLTCVNSVFVFDATDAREVVREIKPSLWVLGDDHQKEDFKDLPCPVCFVERDEHSSTKIREQLLGMKP